MKLDKGILLTLAALIVFVVTLGFVAPALVSSANDFAVIAGFTVAIGGLWVCALLAVKAVREFQNQLKGKDQ